MHCRELDSSVPTIPASYPDLTLRARPNWTAVGFVALLAALHLSVAGRAFVAGRWEGYVSLLFGLLFTAAAVVLFHVRGEVTVLYHRGQLRLRTGPGRWSAERFIPFGAVRAVRVTLGPCGSIRDSFVELVCDREDVTCPPSAVPRQLGLLLAIMIGAPLVKVSEDGAYRDAAAGRQAPPPPPSSQQPHPQAGESAAG
jgi:hypothetical protein